MIVVLAFIIATPLCCVLAVGIKRDLDAAFSRR